MAVHLHRMAGGRTVYEDALPQQLGQQKQEHLICRLVQQASSVSFTILLSLHSLI